MLATFITTTLTPSLMTAGFTSDMTFDLTIGKKYRVFGVSTWQEDDYFCVIDDNRLPSWIPRSLFECSDLSIPNDWIYTQMGDVLKSVHGPEFIARDEESYNALVSLEPDAVDRFWKYVEK